MKTHDIKWNLVLFAPQLAQMTKIGVSFPADNPKRRYHLVYLDKWQYIMNKKLLLKFYNYFNLKTCLYSKLPKLCIMILTSRQNTGHINTTIFNVGNKMSHTLYFHILNWILHSRFRFWDIVDLKLSFWYQNIASAFIN